MCRHENDRINSSGCADITAYEAIKNVRLEERRRLIAELKALANKHGYKIVSTIQLKDMEQNYDAIDKDKFFKTTNGVMEMYYNPDANAGGQLVELTISNDDINEASKLYKNPQDFFLHLEGMAQGVLYDVGTETFKEMAEYLMESKGDFEGCTLKTMNGLKKYAAPEKAKTEKDIER